MKSTLVTILIAAGLSTLSPAAGASEMTIHLLGTDSISSKSASFSCDENALKLGLPGGVFKVDYINGAGNSLAVLPVAGRSLIFANVISGSGARYAADRYTWSDGGSRGATLSSDSLDGHAQTLCKQEK